MYDDSKMSAPLPNWTATFTLRPDLEPPGYAETVIYILENPRPKVKEEEKKEKKNAKRKTKIGRNETF
jgi:hypothetical protein